MKKSLLVFGLGNPGKKYEETFHNAGFQALDKLLEKLESQETFQENKKTGCQLAKIPKKDGFWLLAKPQSFMNLSGEPLKKIIRFHRLNPAEIIIVHDDADLPLGTLRFSFASGSGGHKGLESIFLQTGRQDFHRLRIGIGRSEKSQNLKKFVLEKIPPEKMDSWQKTLEEAAAGLIFFEQNGYEKTASQFNGRLTK